MQGAANSVGIYIASGSVFEDSYNAGASHLLERMAFKSTTNRTHFRLVREVSRTLKLEAVQELCSYLLSDIISLEQPRNKGG